MKRKKSNNYSREFTFIGFLELENPEAVEHLADEFDALQRIIDRKKRKIQGRINPKINKL